MDANNYVTRNADGTFSVVVFGSPSGTFGSQGEAEAVYNRRLGPSNAPSTGTIAQPTNGGGGGGGSSGGSGTGSGALSGALDQLRRQQEAQAAAAQQQLDQQRQAAAAAQARNDAQLAAQQATNSRAAKLLGFNPTANKDRADRALAAIFSNRPEIAQMDINAKDIAGQDAVAATPAQTAYQLTNGQTKTMAQLRQELSSSMNTGPNVPDAQILSAYTRASGNALTPVTIAANPGSPAVAAFKAYDPLDWRAAVQAWATSDQGKANGDLAGAGGDLTKFAQKEGYIAPPPPGSINELLDQVVLDKLRAQGLFSPELEKKVNDQLLKAQQDDIAGTTAAAPAFGESANDWQLDPTTGMYIPNATKVPTGGTAPSPISVQDFRNKFETDTGTGTGPLPPIPSTQLFTQGFNAADRSGTYDLFKSMGIDNNVLTDQIERLAPPSGTSSLANQIFAPQLK